MDVEVGLDSETTILDQCPLINQIISTVVLVLVGNAFRQVEIFTDVSAYFISAPPSEAETRRSGCAKEVKLGLGPVT